MKREVFRESQRSKLLLIAYVLGTLVAASHAGPTAKHRGGRATILQKKDYLKDFRGGHTDQEQDSPSPTEGSIEVTQQPTTSPIRFPTLSPTSFPTFGPTPSPTKLPTAVPTMSPTEEDNGQEPTFTPTSRPSGQSIELCSGSIPVTVSLGPNSDPTGGFVNVPTAQSLENVADCLDINDGEQHTQQSHVWWRSSPLEL